MQHLLSAWPEMASKLKVDTIMLFLDYDGTLTPIVERPQDAKLSLQRRKTLQDLAQTEGIKMALVSGRALRDLKKQLGIQGIIYVGNHGIEFEDDKSYFIYPGALPWKSLLKKLADRLTQILKPFPSVFVENKNFTLSVHYRQLSFEKVDQAKAIFLETIHSNPHFSPFAVTDGKKVWEVRPPTKWDKGRMILWFLARFAAHIPAYVFPIYIGDDQTDEDAFKALRGRGIGVKVSENGNELSEANYYLRSTEEVFDFLKRLKALKKEKRKSSVNC